MKGVKESSRQIAVGAISVRLSQSVPRQRLDVPVIALALVSLVVGLVVLHGARERLRGGYAVSTPHAVSTWNPISVRDEGFAATGRDSRPFDDVRVPSRSQPKNQILVDAPKHQDAGEAEVRAAKPRKSTTATSTAPVAYYIPAPGHAPESTVDALKPLRENRTAGLDSDPSSDVLLTPPRNLVPAMDDMRTSSAKESNLPAAVPEDKPDVSITVDHAVEHYRRALASLLESRNDKSRARRYYAALAHLAELTWEHQSEAGRAELADIDHHPELLELISAAAPSWLQWSGRESDGIVVVGQVESVTAENHGVVVSVRANDRNSSELSLLLPQDARPADTSSSMLFYGVVVAQKSEDRPVIHARIAHGSL